MFDTILALVRAIYGVDPDCVKVEVLFDVYDGNGWRSDVDVAVFIVDVEPHERMLIASENGQFLEECVYKITKQLLADQQRIA